MCYSGERNEKWKMGLRLEGRRMRAGIKRIVFCGLLRLKVIYIQLFNLRVIAS